MSHETDIPSTRARHFAIACLAVIPALIAACSVGDSTLRLTTIANEGVMVDVGSHRILIDALFDSPNPAYLAPPPGLLEKMVAGEAPFGDIDLGLVTHSHPDHFRASVAERFLLGNPRAVLVAPMDAVEMLRDSAEHWSVYEDRVVPIDLGVGEHSTRVHAGIQVHAFRTLHSGERESPMNVMYRVEMGGWTVFHEGDSDYEVNSFRAVVEEGVAIDLALVHFWFPFSEVGRQILDILAPEHVGLIHYPIEELEDFPVGSFRSLKGHYRLLREPGQVSELAKREEP